MTPLEISLKILPALIAILSLLLVIYVGKLITPWQHYIGHTSALMESCTKKKFSLITKKLVDS